MPTSSPSDGRSKVGELLKRRAGRLVGVGSSMLGVAVFPMNVSAQKISAQKVRTPMFVVERLDVTAKKAMTGVSWQPNCPVALADLRRVIVPFVDFENNEKTGAIVVHRDVAQAVGRIFVRLHDAKFPIARIEPIEAFGGDDDRSTMANNTSAFNCRPSFGADGLPTKRWSQHAYGHAVDVNPVQNPYVLANGSVTDPAAKKYIDRSIDEPGMALATGPLVQAFAGEGWKWGGNWHSTKDYQHFSVNGR